MGEHLKKDFHRRQIQMSCAITRVMLGLALHPGSQMVRATPLRRIAECDVPSVVN